MENGVVVNVLRVKDQVSELLYLKRAGSYAGQWWPVTGVSKANETPIEAAIRELSEETGLVPTEIYSLGMNVPRTDGISSLVGFVAYVDAEMLVEINYEHDEYKWLEVNEVFDLVHPAAHIFISHIKKNFIDCHPKSSNRLWRS